MPASVQIRRRWHLGSTRSVIEPPRANALLRRIARDELRDYPGRFDSKRSKGATGLKESSESRFGLNRREGGGCLVGQVAPLVEPRSYSLMR